MKSFTIRPERPEDHRIVENLTRDAFWNVYRPGCDEHFVLHNMRSDECFVAELDYVLEEEGEIIAHIVYAKGRLELDAGGECPILLFGPVSVRPDKQRQGYGSAIIRYTLEKAKELGYPLLVITGSPAYYHRFGFEPASRQGIYYQGMERSQEAPFFMVKILDEAAAKEQQGTYYEPAVYVCDKEALEIFDQEFPEKIKEKRPGQLE